MWARLINELSLESLALRITPDLHRILNLAIFFWPLPFLLVQGWEGGNGGAFNPLFFLAGTFLEFLLSASLFSFRKRALLSRGRSEYLLRSVLGLPFTVYLTLVFPQGYVSAGRILFSGGIVRITSGRNAALWNGFLLLVGIPVFDMMRTGHFPAREIWTLLLFLAIPAFAPLLIVALARKWKREYLLALRRGRSAGFPAKADRRIKVDNQ